MPGTYFGKYRGKVVSNTDDSGVGMLEVTVADVLGENTAWALPSLPFAGPGVGWLMLPPVGADVWVDFERGDPSFPVWSGCFWDTASPFAESTSARVKMLKTECFSLCLDSGGADGGQPTATIQVNVGSQESPRLLSVAFDAAGITLKNDERTVVVGSSSVVVSSGDTSQVTVESGTVTIKNGDTTITVASSSIGLACSSGAVNLSESEVAVSNGVPSVKLTQTSVNVNNGALVVT
ncbi:MAG TPA: phage baseplate assembly protein V [Chloroflexota bacterium]|jgi:uncharacterized protein involved in type VI secretion and phage assembly